MTDPRPPRSRTAAVPQGRARRLLHFGRAVGELAAGAAAEGLSRLARGQMPQVSRMVLTPGNARRLATRLSQLRGAAMKFGQLMSMDGHGVLPPQFTELLGGLRDRAHVMPASQLAEVLEREYGVGWHRRFRSFSFEPIAAASIGQVHRAVTHDGRELALKIQYPGVRESIDSDVSNLALLAKTPGLVPSGLDPAPLFERVRRVLHQETDYVAEARALTEYRERLGADELFVVPEVDAEHSTASILATSFQPGEAIDRLAEPGVPQAHRDRIAHALCRLVVREIFELRLVQTDPNFANYLYDAKTQRVALLDFGATQTVSLQRVEHLRALGRAMRDQDHDAMSRAARRAGFIAESDPPEQARQVVDLILMIGEPLAQDRLFDFAASELFKRSFEAGRDQYFGSGFSHAPPPDLVFLQRKMVGVFMLCTRLKARVNLARLFGEQL
ncbi:ABC1 kinase family protein [Rubrivivax gelatinosus]|uniref:ABC transporter n=1 Tax=Rubrivivax gelatinosus TaxID=28068 RepID=A0ABS1DRI7_RUBGE|nr:AarF/ABC1/UbiB kinase family protein [Rubrivivax gelatinosus]MBK1712009.1 ABC transporter [Rubrivivax gelatinosus]